MSSKVQKLELLEKAPELVIFDEMTALRGQIKAIYGQLKSDSSKEVIEYKTELGTLIEKLDNLQKSIQEKDTVVNIPLDQLSEQIKKVEQAIKGIKEVKIPEVKFPTEYPLSELQINELLLAIQSIPEFPIKELEKMVLGLGSKIEAIKLEVPENKFDYEFLDEKFEKLIKAVKNISITVSSGGGIGEQANLNLETIANSTLNHICTDNTTTTPLGSNATFTGNWQDCLNYQEVNISVDTDQNSATNGLVIEWSADAVNVADTDVFSVYANAGTNYTPNPAFRYVRVKYTNGSVAQTRFSLMTILRRGATGGSFHRITDTLKDDSDGRLNLSVLKLRTAANNYVSGAATNAGNFKVSLEEFDDAVKGQQDQADSLAVTFSKEHYDEMSRLLATLDAEHSAIHKGWHFFVCDYVNPIQVNNTIEFVLTTPNTAVWTHMNLDFSSTLGATLDIYEGSNDVVGGTTVTPVNNNRNSSNTSGLTIVKDPSSITAGTRIAGYLAGANRTSGVQERDRELVLKQNTTYLFRFTSLANSNAISFCGEWYEYASYSNS